MHTAEDGLHAIVPSRLLFGLTCPVAPLALAIPYLPSASWFGFVPLPAQVMAGLVVITLAYITASEIIKHRFFTRARRGPRQESFNDHA